MIIRTYSCLNRNCRNEFDSTRDHPPCPSCRGLRVQWVPKPVAIRGQNSMTSSIDKTARELAADFGLTDFRSPQAGRPAMPPGPVQSGHTLTQPNGHNTFEPMKGWRINLPDDAISGAGHAVCAPTGVTAKIKVDPNAGALPETNRPGMNMRAMRAATKIEGTHRPKG